MQGWRAEGIIMKIKNKRDVYKWVSFRDKKKKGREWQKER